MPTPTAAVLASLTLAGLTLARPSLAQIYANSAPWPLVASASALLDGLEVEGRGSIDIAPSSAVVRLVVQANADSAAGALEAFAARRRQVGDAVANIDGADVTISSRGPRFLSPQEEDGMIAFGGILAAAGAPAAAADGELTCSETLEITATARAGTPLRALAAEILDAGRASGATLPPAYDMFGDTIDPTPVVRYLADESTAQRSQALAAAMADAKQRARDLAALLGVTLGPVVHVDARPAADLFPPLGFSDDSPTRRELAVRVRFSMRASPR